MNNINEPNDKITSSTGAVSPYIAGSEFCKGLLRAGEITVQFAEKLKPVMIQINKMSDIALKVAEHFPRLTAIFQLSAAQYVYWNYLSDEQVKKIFIF